MPSEAVRERCRKLRVLIAEDDEDIAGLVAAVLEDLKVATIWTASDGAKAWDIFLQLRNQIDLVIADWVMPKMDGLDLLRRVREARPSVPFLMLTGKVTAASVAAARQLGVSAYIAKPFDPADLRKKIIALFTPDETGKTAGGKS